MSFRAGTGLIARQGIILRSTKFEERDIVSGEIWIKESTVVVFVDLHKLEFLTSPGVPRAIKAYFTIAHEFGTVTPSVARCGAIFIREPYHQTKATLIHQQEWIAILSHSVWPSHPRRDRDCHA